MRRLVLLALLAALVLAACGSNTTAPTPSASGLATASAAPDASASPGSSATPGASAAPDASATASVDPNAEPTPPADDTGEIPSDAAVTPQPTPGASASPTIPPRTACGKINDAIDMVDLYLQYFTQADETTWQDMTGPESPIEFDRATFTKAIALLAKDPAMKSAGPLLRSLDKALGKALASDDPFGSASAPGSVLVRASTKNFVQIEKALVAVRTAQGCG
jgi:hypothetical protein